MWPVFKLSLEDEGERRASESFEDGCWEELVWTAEEAACLPLGMIGGRKLAEVTAPGSLGADWFSCHRPEGCVERGPLTSLGVLWKMTYLLFG